MECRTLHWKLLSINEKLQDSSMINFELSMHRQTNKWQMSKHQKKHQWYTAQLPPEKRQKQMRHVADAPVAVTIMGADAAPQWVRRAASVKLSPTLE